MSVYWVKLSSAGWFLSVDDGREKRERERFRIERLKVPFEWWVGLDELVGSAAGLLSRIIDGCIGTDGESLRCCPLGRS